MTELISTTPLIPPSIFVILLLNAVVFLVSASALLITLFHELKVPKKKKVTAFSLLLGIGLFTPLVVGMSIIGINAANIQKVVLEKLEVNSIDTGLVLVSYSTKEPALSYLRYKDATQEVFKPIMPPYPLELKYEHEVVVDVSPEGGEVTFVINDKEYQQKEGMMSITSSK